MTKTYHNNDSGGESFNDVPEPDQVLYEDKTDAEMAADARGCQGTHPHDVDGRTHHMPCASHSDYHDADGGMSGQSEGSYVGGPFDLTTGISGDGDMTSGDPLDTKGGFLDEPPSPDDGGIDRTMTEFNELTTEGDDPFLVGNPGEFNSPYESDKDKEGKYE